MTIPNHTLSPAEWWLYLTLHCHQQNDDYTWSYTVTTRMMTIPNPTLSPPEWWLYLTLLCHHQNDDYTYHCTITTRMMTIPKTVLSPPEWWLYLTLQCHHQNDSCILMFYWLRDKVTRLCPQTTTFEEKGEPKRPYRTEVLPLTSIPPYR